MTDVDVGTVDLDELGPVDYLVVEFPKGQQNFTGEMGAELVRLSQDGTIRILDLVFVKKDAEGNVLSFEFSDLPEAAVFADIDGDADGLLSDEDVEVAAEMLAPDSSALFVLWEDRWAADLASAIAAAGGELVIGERIPRDVIQASFDSINTSDEEGSS